MKRILLFALAAFTLFAVSCGGNKDNGDDDGPSLEINAANLAGIWEVDIEHDIAQGYHRKYRISFDGQNYTLWTMQQEALKLDKNSSEYTMKDVGDKYMGTWEYSGGKLTMTHTNWWSSHQMKYDTWDDYQTGKYYYVANEYDVVTMEANPWIDLNDNASMLTPTEWTLQTLTATTLKARINMDNVTFRKK